MVREVVLNQQKRRFANDAERLCEELEVGTSRKNIIKSKKHGDMLSKPF